MVRSSRLKFRIAASLVMVFLVLCTLEAIARNISPELPYLNNDSNQGVVLIDSPTRLWTLNPGTQRNGPHMVAINRLGLRGPLPITPRLTQQRVLILGDSSFFGHGIPDDQTIAVQLEGLLQKQDIDADTVNGAIPGYSTEQTRILLDEVGWDTEPTLLLIGSLWSDNNVDGFRDKDLLRTAQLRRSPMAWSALYRLISFTLDSFRPQSNAQVITWTKESTWPADRQRRVPLQDYASNLDRIIRDAQKRGVGVALLAPTNQGLANNEYPDGASWDPYFDAQKRIAEHHRLPVVSFLRAMRGDPRPTSEKFVDLMHPSGSGAGLIAQEILATLIQAGWPGVALLGQELPFDASVLTDDTRFRPAGDDVYTLQKELFTHTEVGASPTPAQNTPRREVAGWSITGTLEGCSLPARVTLFGVDLRAQGFVNLSGSEPFKFTGHGERVVVKVKTASDEEFSAEVREGQSRVVVVCR